MSRLEHRLVPTQPLAVDEPRLENRRIVTALMDSFVDRIRGGRPACSTIEPAVLSPLSPLSLRCRHRPVRDTDRQGSHCQQSRRGRPVAPGHRSRDRRGHAWPRSSDSLCSRSMRTESCRSTCSTTCAWTSWIARTRPSSPPCGHTRTALAGALLGPSSEFAPETSSHHRFKTEVSL